MARNQHGMNGEVLGLGVFGLTQWETYTSCTSCRDVAFSHVPNQDDMPLLHDLPQRFSVLMRVSSTMSKTPTDQLEALLLIWPQQLITLQICWVVENLPSLRI